MIKINSWFTVIPKQHLRIILSEANRKRYTKKQSVSFEEEKAK